LSTVPTCQALPIPRPPDASARARRRRAGLVLLASFALGSLVDAQVRVVRRGDDRLRGIRSVDVVVIDTPPSDSECAVGTRTLQEGAVAALQATGLRGTVSAKAPSWFYTVEIDVRSLRAGEHCVTSLSADLIAHVDGSPEADRGLPANAWGSLLVGTMRLVHESALLAAPRDQHAMRVAAELRARLTAIGERVKRANE
jgi:hypothetical protein